MEEARVDTPSRHVWMKCDNTGSFESDGCAADEAAQLPFEISVRKGRDLRGRRAEKIQYALFL